MTREVNVYGKEFKMKPVLTMGTSSRLMYFLEDLRENGLRGADLVLDLRPLRNSVF